MSHCVLQKHNLSLDLHNSSLSIVTSAGIKGLPHVINAAILIFTFSAANSDQYIASRTLYGLARDGHAPKIFARCTKRGVPYVAFIFTGCFMGLAYLSASEGEQRSFGHLLAYLCQDTHRHSLTTDALKIFNYFVSAVTIFGSLTWISILSSFIAFQRAMKAQGISRDTLPYKARKFAWSGRKSTRHCAQLNSFAIIISFATVLVLLCTLLHRRSQYLQGFRCLYAFRLQVFHYSLHWNSRLRHCILWIQV